MIRFNCIISLTLKTNVNSRRFQSISNIHYLVYSSYVISLFQFEPMMLPRRLSQTGNILSWSECCSSLIEKIGLLQCDIKPGKSGNNFLDAVLKFDVLSSLINLLNYFSVRQTLFLVICFNQLSRPLQFMVRQFPARLIHFYGLRNDENMYNWQMAILLTIEISKPRKTQFLIYILTCD